MKLIIGNPKARGFKRNFKETSFMVSFGFRIETMSEREKNAVKSHVLRLAPNISISETQVLRLEDSALSEPLNYFFQTEREAEEWFDKLLFMFSEKRWFKITLESENKVKDSNV